MRRESDERIAAAERVVDEGKRVIFGEGREPERKLGQVDGEGVLVHAVKTSLRHHPAGVQQRVLIRWDRRQLVVRDPRLLRPFAKVAAGFYEERTGTHGGVTDLQAQDLFRRRVVSQLGQHRIERRLDDRLRERTRRVVRTGTARSSVG
jgi:hypothetical protein